MLELSHALGYSLLPGTLVASLKQLPGCCRGLLWVAALPAKMSWKDDVHVHLYVATPSVLPPPADTGWLGGPPSPRRWLEGEKKTCTSKRREVY